MTAADWWFAGLDQRTFVAGAARWTIQVLGVYIDGFHTWIQIEFAEDPDSSLLLHLTPWAGSQDAIGIVKAKMTGVTSGDVHTHSLASLGNCRNVIVPSASAIAAASEAMD